MFLFWLTEKKKILYCPCPVLEEVLNWQPDSDCDNFLDFHILFSVHSKEGVIKADLTYFMN